jgi:long-subunit fatty acid transport protein
MRKIIILTVILCAYNIAVFSQGNEIDAYTMSGTELNGTARSMAMGGAFGALGGDISVISVNPAGLGIYRSSEVNGTLGLSMVNNLTNWYGKTKEVNKSSFSPDNLGFELYLPTSSESLLNWNLAFSYNRVKNFTREYKMENQSGMKYSIGDYVASRSSGIPEGDLIYVENGYDPYYNPDLAGSWLSILGYESYMINPVEGQEKTYSGFFDNHKPTEGYLRVTENGYIDEMNFGTGMNISNLLFLGASVSVTDFSYILNSAYEEYNQLKDHIYLDNWLTTEGKGYSFNFGAILNFQVIRLGAAYSTPKWYNMTDYYDARAITFLDGENGDFVRNTPENSYSEYKFKTPGKWTFSGAVIVGKSALLSADYELTNYKNMKYRNTYGDDLDTNLDIKEDFGYSHTLRLGGELKITPQFAIRGGYAMQTSPMKTKLVNNDVEVLPSGTIPHFTTTAASTNYITAGLGYRFTPNFYMDLACVYKINKGNAYAFSNRYNNDHSVDVASTPASLTNKSTRLALTLGYKI